MTRATLSPRRSRLLAEAMAELASDAAIFGGEVILEPEDSGALHIGIVDRGIIRKEQWL